MNKGLSFNICRLESSYVVNKDIPDLPLLIKKYISEHLYYSCQFWTRHLDIALLNGMALGSSCQIREHLEPFAKEKILFCLEVLSVLDIVALAIPSLVIVARVLTMDICQ